MRKYRRVRLTFLASVTGLAALLGCQRAASEPVDDATLLFRASAILGEDPSLLQAPAADVAAKLGLDPSRFELTRSSDRSSEVWLRIDPTTDVPLERFADLMDFDAEIEIPAVTDAVIYEFVVDGSEDIPWGNGLTLVVSPEPHPDQLETTFVERISYLRPLRSNPKTVSIAGGTLDYITFTAPKG